MLPFGLELTFSFLMGVKGRTSEGDEEERRGEQDRRFGRAFVCPGLVVRI